ncbi:MAG: hypothetical protein O3B74_04565 [Proteobacteria bacterium]|nr:hypothetical protein [Pseudomonadota bacterium]MDA1309491.1 hypothetical protein [Pseudomonadota bacterium]
MAAPAGYRVASILVTAFGAMFLVITASLSALVGRSASVGPGPLSEPWLDTLLWINAGGPLIVMIGLALRRVRVSAFCQSIIAICLTGLWVYGRFISRALF